MTSGRSDTGDYAAFEIRRPHRREQRGIVIGQQPVATAAGTSLP